MDKFYLILDIVYPVATMLALFIVMRRKTAKFAGYLRTEISKVRNIIFESRAKYNGYSGWMFFSEDAIEFYRPLGKSNYEGVPILIDDIANVEANGKHLYINTKASDNYTFTVSNADVWKKTIEHKL